uniref:Uncharacterized protein n=1 Tax=Chromera velia CCMP2878 TaxID=1169474 RepID=A0A0G4HR06_9ALVE|eukprot:Cvel_8016.t1-p1 / transcript=Cvel_8016.t1 / gene=Cvel_8016 / organism=Chromera_velia_CCMP2878 / gene_product=hypothetical protein / transcript_product=hypothetical protein / location=Cvel_scaffold433:23335-36697(-) / protein_length=2172 / sequence_SO=supercontig / SO=protein_coding / is_pseudo=false
MLSQSATAKKLVAALKETGRGNRGGGGEKVKNAPEEPKEKEKEKEKSEAGGALAVSRASSATVIEKERVPERLYLKKEKPAFSTENEKWFLRLCRYVFFVTLFEMLAVVFALFLVRFPNINRIKKREEEEEEELRKQEEEAERRQNEEEEKKGAEGEAESEGLKLQASASLLEAPPRSEAEGGDGEEDAEDFESRKGGMMSPPASAITVPRRIREGLGREKVSVREAMEAVEAVIDDPDVKGPGTPVGRGPGPVPPSPWGGGTVSSFPNAPWSARTARRRISLSGTSAIGTPAGHRKSVVQIGVDLILGGTAEERRKSIKPLDGQRNLLEDEEGAKGNRGREGEEGLREDGEGVDRDVEGGEGEEEENGNAGPVREWFYSDVRRRTVLLVMTHMLCGTEDGKELITNTLRAAVQVLPPGNIIICDNARPLSPPDNEWQVIEEASDEMGCDPYGVDPAKSPRRNGRFHYIYMPVGNKTISQYWALKYWIPKLEKEGRTAAGAEQGWRISYCMMIDDDVQVRGGINKSGIEYLSAGLFKRFQAVVGSALHPHGASSIWRRHVLTDKVFPPHDTEFLGDDVQQGMRTALADDIILEERVIDGNGKKVVKMKSAAETVAAEWDEGGSMRRGRGVGKSVKDDGGPNRDESQVDVQLSPVRKTFWLDYLVESCIATEAPADFVTLWKQRWLSWDLAANRHPLIALFFVAGTLKNGNWRIQFANIFLVVDTISQMLEWTKWPALIYAGLISPLILLPIFFAFLLFDYGFLAILWFKTRNRGLQQITWYAYLFFPFYRLISSLLFRQSAMVENVVRYTAAKKKAISISQREKDGSMLPCPPPEVETTEVDWRSIWKLPDGFLVKKHPRTSQYPGVKCEPEWTAVKVMGLFFFAFLVYWILPLLPKTENPGETGVQSQITALVCIIVGGLIWMVVWSALPEKYWGPHAQNEDVQYQRNNESRMDAFCFAPRVAGLAARARAHMEGQRIPKGAAWEVLSCGRRAQHVIALWLPQSLFRLCCWRRKVVGKGAEEGEGGEGAGLTGVVGAQGAGPRGSTGSTRNRGSRGSNNRLVGSRTKRFWRDVESAGWSWDESTAACSSVQRGPVAPTLQVVEDLRSFRELGRKHRRASLTMSFRTYRFRSRQMFDDSMFVQKDTDNGNKVPKSPSKSMIRGSGGSRFSLFGIPIGGGGKRSLPASPLTPNRKAASPNDQPGPPSVRSALRLPFGGSSRNLGQSAGSAVRFLQNSTAGHAPVPAGDEDEIPVAEVVPSGDRDGIPRPDSWEGNVNVKVDMPPSSPKRPTLVGFLPERHHQMPPPEEAEEEEDLDLGEVPLRRKNSILERNRPPPLGRLDSTDGPTGPSVQAGGRPPPLGPLEFEPEGEEEEEESPSGHLPLSARSPSKKQLLFALGPDEEEREKEKAQTPSRPSRRSVARPPDSQASMDGFFRGDSQESQIERQWSARRSPSRSEMDSADWQVRSTGSARIVRGISDALSAATRTAQEREAAREEAAKEQAAMPAASTRRLPNRQIWLRDHPVFSLLAFTQRNPHAPLLGSVLIVCFHILIPVVVFLLPDGLLPTQLTDPVRGVKLANSCVLATAALAVVQPLGALVDWFFFYSPKESLSIADVEDKFVRQQAALIATSFRAVGRRISLAVTGRASEVGTPRAKSASRAALRDGWGGAPSPGGASSPSTPGLGKGAPWQPDGMNLFETAVSDQSPEIKGRSPANLPHLPSSPVKAVPRMSSLKKSPSSPTPQHSQSGRGLLIEVPVSDPSPEIKGRSPANLPSLPSAPTPVGDPQSRETEGPLVEMPVSDPSPEVKGRSPANLAAPPSPISAESPQSRPKQGLIEVPVSDTSPEAIKARSPAANVLLESANNSESKDGNSKSQASLEKGRSQGAETPQSRRSLGGFRVSFHQGMSAEIEDDLQGDEEGGNGGKPETPEVGGATPKAGGTETPGTPKAGGTTPKGGEGTPRSAGRGQLQIIAMSYGERFRRRAIRMERVGTLILSVVCVVAAGAALYLSLLPRPISDTGAFEMRLGMLMILYLLFFPFCYSVMLVFLVRLCIHRESFERFANAFPGLLRFQSCAKQPCPVGVWREAWEVLDKQRKQKVRKANTMEVAARRESLTGEDLVPQTESQIVALYGEIGWLSQGAQTRQQTAPSGASAEVNLEDFQLEEKKPKVVRS